MCVKLDSSSFSHTRDIIRAPKFKVGHVTLKAPLKVICHLYAGTWHSLCTKFEHHSFSRSSDMAGWCPPKFKWFTWPDRTHFRDDHWIVICG